MLKLPLKPALLLFCVIIWFILLANVALPASIIGDIKLWGSLLSIPLGLSLWAHFSLQSKASQDAYDSLFRVGVFYMCLYAFYRMFFSVILEGFLHLPLSPFVAAGLIFPFLIWTIIHTQVIPILLSHGHLEQASRYLAAMQKHFPQSIELSKQKLMLVKQQGNESAVLDELSSIITLYHTPMTFSTPEEVNRFLTAIHRERLILYLVMGQDEKALADARFMISLKHEVDLALIYRGRAFLLVNDLDAAVADLEQALTIATLPQRKVMAKISLGLIEYILENDEQAEAYWTSAMRFIDDLAPDEKHFYSAQIHVSRGLMAFHRGDTGKAWQEYDRALRSDRHSAEARLGMAVIHAAEEHWDKALKIWRVLLAEYPYFADPEAVISRHFRWTPPMAEGVRQIAAQLDAPPKEHIDYQAEQARTGALISR